MTGQVLGSPNFMPPEQAGGGWQLTSDVSRSAFSLLLTARAPFQADSLEHLIPKCSKTEPVAPRLVVRFPEIWRRSPQVSGGRPSRRYQTAQELADELESCATGIRARPIHNRKNSGAGAAASPRDRPCFRPRRAGDWPRQLPGNGSGRGMERAP
jgi:hypothetical protein